MRVGRRPPHVGGDQDIGVEGGVLNVLQLHRSQENIGPELHVPVMTNRRTEIFTEAFLPNRLEHHIEISSQDVRHSFGDRKLYPGFDHLHACAKDSMRPFSSKPEDHQLRVMIGRHEPDRVSEARAFFTNAWSNMKAMPPIFPDVIRNLFVGTVLHSFVV